MNNSKKIPYSRIEEIRRLNQCIKETPDEWEKEIYKKIKKIHIPYERLDSILQESREKIILARRKRCIRMSIIFIVFVILVLLLLAFLIKR